MIYTRLYSTFKNLGTPFLSYLADANATPLPQDLVKSQSRKIQFKFRFPNRFENYLSPGQKPCPDACQWQNDRIIIKYNIAASRLNGI